MNVITNAFCYSTTCFLTTVALEFLICCCDSTQNRIARSGSFNCELFHRTGMFGSGVEPSSNNKWELSLVIACNITNFIVVLRKNCPWPKQTSSNLFSWWNWNVKVFLETRTETRILICDSFCACYAIAINWTKRIRIRRSKNWPLIRPVGSCSHHIQRLSWWNGRRNYWIFAIINFNHSWCIFYEGQWVANSYCSSLLCPEHSCWSCYSNYSCGCINSYVRVSCCVTVCNWIR